MIEFRRVTKQFPDGTVAVEDVDIVMPPHKTTVLVGSSGSGKTTLLRMINRMVDPTGGQVLIDGTDVATRDPVQLRRGIGYVMQNSGLLPHRRVIDNIATVPLLRGTPKREAYEHALELLDTVGLDRSLADRYPSQLSGGQQQRVGVARGLAVDPNILLMDEPFGAVDPIVRAELQQELLRAAGRARQDHRVRDARHRRGVPARRPGRDHAAAAARSRRPRRRPRSSRTRPTSSWRTSSGPTAASAPCT